MYTQELLQFGDNLSMLLLLPPSEDFSSSYWPLVGIKEPGLTMPLQIFELGKWKTIYPVDLFNNGSAECFSDEKRDPETAS